MSGYRNELDSALRQIDELRAETTRLRIELDETRRASGSMIAQAIVGWSHARRWTRGAVVLGPALTVLAIGGVMAALTALDRHRPPTAPGAVEPLTPYTRPACPACPEQRPCVQRHTAEPRTVPDALGDAGLSVSAEGVILAPSSLAGVPYLDPTHDDTACDPREGTLVLHTRGIGHCVIGSTAFRAPATLRLRQGDYDLRCTNWNNEQRKRWRVRIEAGMVTESWSEDLAQPATRGARMRPDLWIPQPPRQP